MRISATILDSFRLYLSEDWMTEADLQARIKGEQVQTPELKIGRSYHALLEKPQRSLSGQYEHDGLIFEDAAIENMLDLIEPGLFEVKTTKDVMVPGYGPVTLVTKCDHIRGAAIAEFKTTLDSFDSEKYLGSVQWKTMLLLFQASLVTYHVALLREERDHDYAQQQGPRYALRSIESLNVFGYADLEREVLSLVKDFCGYVKQRGLTEYLIPKVKAEAR
jgi:hypothetical protein